MSKLADVVLDYLWFLNFSDEEELDLDRAIQRMEELAYQIENEFSEGEKNQLQDAARRRLAWWLREPDEDGYAPRMLLTDEQKEFLQAIAGGNFSGSLDVG